MGIESLKEQARKYEQQEDWGKALDLYLQAIRQASEDEHPDIGLYNRAGDIQTRMGNLDGAVVHYERAIDLYLEADLPNNAIAVCKKVLRNLPSRTAMFLRMGQIRAAQGFLTDARQNFLTYAEKMQKAGEMEEAFRALEEFADAAPEDLEVRLALASQLESHGRVGEAVLQLRMAHAHLVRSGEMDRAEELADRILSLDSGVDLSVLPDPPRPWKGAGAPPESEADGDGFRLEATALEGELPGGGTAGGGPSSGLEPGGVQVAGSGWGEADGVGSGAAEVGVRTEGSPEEDDEAFGGVEVPLSGVEGGLALPSDLPPGTETWDELPEEEPLPFMTDPGMGLEVELAGEEDPGESRWLAGEEFDLDEAHPVASDTDGREGVLEEELPLLTDDLPLLADDEVEELPPGVAGSVESPFETETEDAEALRARLEEDPGDGDGWMSLARLRMQGGDAEGAREALERAHPALLAVGDVEGALEAVRLLLTDRPDDVALHQRFVEYAYRDPSRRHLVPGFLGLAGALVRGGEGEKARAVYRQVLALEPGHPVAVHELSALEPESTPANPYEAPAPEPSPPPPPPSSPAAPPPPPPGGEDYIDLGSLVLDDPPERTTRWFVPAEEPSGDDEADFARMLSQFKAKVAENLAGDDAVAHYDLGTAYKEMGLLQEAIAEFQRSLRADPRSLGTYEMLGQCFLEAGQPEVAVRTLDRALGLAFDVEDDLLGIYYYAARAHEVLGNSAQAREFYEKVFSLDINFKDVTERLRALR